VQPGLPFGSVTHPPGGGRELPGPNGFGVEFVRSGRARRYVLRVRDDGRVRVTIPRGGSVREARQFAEEHRAWITAERLRFAVARRPRLVWRDGTEILFRGRTTAVRCTARGESSEIRFADQVVVVSGQPADLRPAVEAHLRGLAARELGPRLLALAAEQGLRVARVSVRAQRTRWGSCSPRGHIALNWRLVQVPAEVCDYVLLHELMHLREANHSPRFWRHVARVCPGYQAARRWLREHGLRLERAGG